MLNTNTYTPHNQNNFPCGHFTPGHTAHASLNLIKIYNANDIPWNQQLAKTSDLIEEQTALSIKIVPVILYPLSYFSYDFYEEVQPSKYECLLILQFLSLLLHNDHHTRSFLLFLHDPTCSKSSCCYTLPTVLDIYLIAKSSVHKDKSNICLLFPNNNESSFLFWGLKIMIFTWFECFILTPTPHTIKITSFLVVIYL